MSGSGSTSDDGSNKDNDHDHDHDHDDRRCDRDQDKDDDGGDPDNRQRDAEAEALYRQRLEIRQQHAQIYRMKRDTPTSELCAGLPRIFARFLDYVLDFQYAREPDYDMLQQAFFSEINKHSAGIDYQVDWMSSHEATRPL